MGEPPGPGASPAATPPASPPARPEAGGRLHVAYVMTHYPKHSQTFLLDEVLGVQGEHITIVPIALNPPESGDAVSEVERGEEERTFYVKAVPKGRIVRELASLVARNPVGMLRVLLGAVRSAGLDASRLLWSVFYTVEAALVWRHCEQQGCRHIHAQFGTAPATVAMLAARIGNLVGSRDSRVTWSFTVHGYHEFTAEEAYDIAGKVADADRVVAVSDYTRSQLMRLSPPAAWGKIRRVHCGIDLGQFAFAPRAEARCPAVVVTVGRLSPEKGQLLLVEAARLLKDRGVDVRVRIVGSGPSEAELRDQIARLGVGAIVELTGAVPAAEVAGHLRDADVFCLASFAEGIPVSVMEALACGVPVVATQVGGVGELVVDGVTGRTVPAGRTDLLADAIESLVVDAERRSRVQSAGRSLVEREHDGRQTTATMRELLLEVTAHQGPA